MFTSEQPYTTSLARSHVFYLLAALHLFVSAVAGYSARHDGEVPKLQADRRFHTME